MAKTIEQERAADALKGIKNAIANGVRRKEFVSYASGFPMMIHTNGLGQAVAFYAGKKEKEYKELLNMLKEWLASTDRPFAGEPDLLNAITNNNMQTYMLAQAEAMAYLVWVKKFAKALIDTDSKGGDNG
ncbi:MAG: type III-B CRISPR module-associated protein Cmr5 [Wolinella succinogenes]|uniref:type III-B CRISPR module-associated protein Cmr5 n=1 Tax=Wolinella succinogenes TaxID=844 RepID=UPI0016B2E832|nr:type III-B CRISPR module-associated protein Cmr5 [Wolinella succinogenes]NLU33508.1 type III-B CRISPR module-associated protein Cmr5 [Wolinella succinogenes]